MPLLSFFAARFLAGSSRRLAPLALLGIFALAPPLGAEGLHQHPLSEVLSPPEEIGLDERLGAHIPLDLSFADERGETVALRDLVTGPTIIVPVYYGCPNVCSFLQGGLAQALPGIRLKPGEDYRVLSVSFDETETPATAAKARSIYYATLGKDFPADAWLFLTGDLPAIQALTSAAGYRFTRRGNDFLHPVAVFIVDGDGQIVRYLQGTSFLPMELTLALVEASEGRMGTTVRKLVKFCFSYDAVGKRYVFNLLRVSATVVIATAAAFFLFLFLTGRRRRE
jgi:protein SCO1/2